MSITKKLHTTEPEFDGLHQVIAKARSTTTKVTVDRKALAHLLMDHANLIHIVDQRGDG